MRKQTNESENIKKFLLNQLKFTPRRVLFEEFDEKLKFNKKDEMKSSKNSQTSKSLKAELDSLQKLQKFRFNNARECMGEVNSFGRLKDPQKWTQNFPKWS